jgi:ubiquinone/menaquinone biosynthesis C-methylase UbiE
MTNPTLAEYYRQRAGEYDEVYLKPERQRDLAALMALLPPIVAGRRVLEIAAGTGYWTRVIAPAAASITATDLNPETLHVAASRDYGQAAPVLMTADAYRLADVPGEFDLVFCGFWWSHVPRADVTRFLAGLRQRVQPGTTLVILDNRYVPGSNHPITRTGPQGDTYQLRALPDGRQYEVLKNFPTRQQLAADLAPWAAGLRYTELEYYWLACCELTGPAPA